MEHHRVRSALLSEVVSAKSWKAEATTSPASADALLPRRYWANQGIDTTGKVIDGSGTYNKSGA
jgi:hypothetical protein